MREPSLGPALLGEALGTFILVFAGCGAIAIGTLPPTGVAAAFGLAIMVAIYALGHVSGAHFNPAVTAAFAAGRHFPIQRVLPYRIAQGCGAIAAAGLLRLSPGAGSLGVTQPAGSDLQGFAWEAVLTFVLISSLSPWPRIPGPSARRPRSLPGTSRACGST